MERIQHNLGDELSNLNSDGTPKNTFWTEANYTTALEEEMQEKEGDYIEKKRVEMGKSYFLNKTKLLNVKSLQGISPFIVEYVQKYGYLKIIPDSRDFSEGGSGVRAKTFYEIFSCTFEGSDIPYDNSKEYYEEINQDMKQTLETLVKPFIVEEKGSSWIVKESNQ